MNELDFSENFEEYNYGELFPGVRIPLVEIDGDDLATYGLLPEDSAIEKLTKLCRKGYIDKRINDLPNRQEYIDRIKYELGVIEKIGFSDYFLILWDFTNWCRKNDIMTGPSRGSASGSCIFYLIGVTKLDPIKYNLIFERFINETRASVSEVNGVKLLTGLIPDVDMDLDFLDRGKTIENYLKVKYAGRTVKTLTVLALKTKQCLKDVGKTLGGKTENEMNKVTSLVDVVFGKPRSVDETIESSEEFSYWAKANPEVIKVTKKLVNLPRGFGVHASGYLVSYDKIIDTMPIQLDGHGEQISCYTKEQAELLAPKLDFLGLTTISLIKSTARDAKYDLDSFDENDPFIYDILQSFRESYGIFQLDGGTAKKLIQRIKPKSIHEVSDISAIARPGAIDSADQYQKYKETGEVESIHPEIDKILNPTGNILIFQEQLMSVSSKVFGLSLAEADNLRKCVGRKKKEEMQKFETIIRDNARKLGIPDDVAQYFWDACNKSADYQFSLNHSAAYAYISVLTVYLKFKYPIHFFKNCLSLLQYENNSPQQSLSKIKQEMDVFKIRLGPPDLIKSSDDFTVDGNTIRYGLQSIKSVSSKSLEKLKNFDSDVGNKFKLFESAKESGIPISILKNLIRAGCLSSFGENRGRLVLEACTWNLLTDSQKSKIIKFGPKYNYDILDILVAMKDGKIRDGEKEIISTQKRKNGGNSPWDNFYAKYTPFKEEYEDYQGQAKFFDYYFENSILGFSYSSSLKSILAEKYDNVISVSEIENEEIDSTIIFGGIVQEAKIGKTKKGGKMLSLTVSDETGLVNVKMFNYATRDGEVNNVDELEKENGRLPEKGDVVVVRASKKDRVAFSDKIRILNLNYQKA